MEWNAYPQTRPNTSSPFLVSIKRRGTHSWNFFQYMAWYDHKKRAWHQYNPFKENSVGVVIEETVVGWADNIIAYTA